jgi:SAM-dependent methyltransferase
MMDRPVGTESTNPMAVKKIIRELKYYNLKNNGLLLSWYYKLTRKSCSFQGGVRLWEYIWSITNSKFRAGEHVLDAGCGNSPLLFYLYKRGCLCYGLDNKFSSEVYPISIFSLRRKIVVSLFKSRLLSSLINYQYHWGLSYSNNALGFRIHYIKGDMSDMPFAGPYFDHIFCNSVIEHLSREEMIRAALEFKRILKTGGFLIATVDYVDTGLLWRDFIEATGLKLCGEPVFHKVKNRYETVGFILQKQ